MEDLRLTEINLDQIETFLRAVAYDQAVTPTTVSERIGRLKTRVQAPEGVGRGVGAPDQRGRVRPWALTGVSTVDRQITTVSAYH